MNPDNLDEIFRIVSRLIDEFISDGCGPSGGRLNGYAIIAGPGGIPAVVRIQRGNTPVLFPEVIEGGDEIHVTAALPPGCDILPSVTFGALLVVISLGKETAEVPVPSCIDPQRCSWRVKNGVLDITCGKV